MGVGEWFGVLGELFKPTFWRQLVTDPLAAVRADPELALKAGAVAGGAALTGGLVLKAGLVGGAVRAVAGVGRAAVGLASLPFRAAAAAAPALGFAAKHPIATYVILANADLPSQVASAFQVQISVGGGPLARHLPSAPVRPRLAVQSRQDAWARLFQGQAVGLAR